MSIFSKSRKKAVLAREKDKKPAIASVCIRSITDNGDFVGFAKIGGSGYVDINNIYVPFCINQQQTKRHIHPEATVFYGRLDHLVKNYNLRIEAERKMVVSLLDDRRYQDKTLEGSHCATAVGCLQHELGPSKFAALQHGKVFYCIPVEALQLADRRKRLLEILIKTLEKSLPQLTRGWTYTALTDKRMPALLQYPRSFEEEVRRQGGYYHSNHRLYEKVRTPGEFRVEV